MQIKNYPLFLNKITKASITHISKNTAKLLVLSSFLLTPMAAQAGMKIVYIRHAEAGHNVKKDWANVPKAEWPSYVGNHLELTPKGLIQQSQVAEKLSHFKIDFIASSTAWRCKQTILPYMKKFGLKGEVWPELHELRADKSIIANDLPVYREKVLGMGKPVTLSTDEMNYFSLLDDGHKGFKVPRPGSSKEKNLQSSSAAKIVIQKALGMIQARFGGSDKTILLSGHGSSGKAVLRMLTKDPLDHYPGISNTGIWMVEEQDNGEFTLKIFNDAPVANIKTQYTVNKS